MFKIGQVAEMVGYSVESIRHYESKGLLTPHARSPSGQRLFHKCDIDRLLFIKSLRKIGMSLKDISVLINSKDQETFCIKLDGLYAKYLNVFQEKRREIDACEEELIQKKKKCASCEHYKYIKQGSVDKK